MPADFLTDAENTWCPGCGNFSILYSLKRIIENYKKEGGDTKKIVLVTGIGCHAKIADYLDINSVYSLHGRAVPFASGIKIADPGLKVICCVGDGDSYAEGLEHILFAAKRNTDITVIVHDNRVYGLTIGQYTPTSPSDYHGKTNPPDGCDLPFNPLKLMLCSGASFIARGYTGKMKQLESLIKAGMDHKGFSMVEVLQICASFYNKRDLYDKYTYEYKGDAKTAAKALEAAGEWDYNSESPIPLGIIYDSERKTFEERFKDIKKDNDKQKTAVLKYLGR
ncbi:2-oxoglutarate ferredoxin oxidoreductase subunit beta [Methanomicrobium sp. W14]|uniref:thiamine pyrophosphate-dependent enzyme n=1 Tax=Methanomicrobium sp. W14 TaxID=2817839 RepID=UPI001AEA5F07|nr:thiamine pyrophosphate-dependent enzyme [Methanomicrobium sp. W14]MBP2133273.1 2-oxoglutarate ferredoxin oxidoreductase subunit beta [Methanomicrobium sp. W14]